MNKFLVSAAVAGSLLAFNALADDESGLTIEVGVVTNYIDSGETLSDDKPALQAEAVYEHASGAYGGLWLSTVDDGDDSGLEYELFGGYAGDVEQFGYDIGLSYSKNTIESSDYEMELALEGSYKFNDDMTLALGYSRIISAKDSDSEGDGYFEVNFERTNCLGMFDWDIHYGYSMPDASGADNETDIALTVSKGDFEFAKDVTFGATISKWSLDDGDGSDDLKALVFAKYTFGL